MMSEMTDEEYTRAQHAVVSMAFLALPHDFNAMLGRIGHTHSLAPMLDPTLYRTGASRLEQVERLVRAAAAFKVIAVDAIGKLDALSGS